MPTPQRPENAPARGRWAPTPSGLLHLGSARTALAAWLSVRSRGGTFLWRIEDLDPPRVVPGTAEAALEDLAWLGLDWDEGPVEGPCGPYRQSERSEHYDRALERLAAGGHLFPCALSRKDLQELATAPHGPGIVVDGEVLPGDAAPYPASCRPERLEPGWFERFRQADDPAAALRFRVSPEPVVYGDRVQGPVTERVDRTAGDFVVQRKDGLYAYQLAVVVDDLAMGVTEVVRGADLLDSTGRQLQLIDALGGTPPAYAHLPLVLGPDGEKLSKRHDSLTLRSLREAGAAPERVVGLLAASLLEGVPGLEERAEGWHPRELVEVFAWERVRREPWRVPEELAVALIGA